MTLPRDELPTGTSSPSFHQFPNPPKILFVFGTRPEAIKLCPVIRAMRVSAPHVEVLVCITAQHREMLDQVLSAFGVEPDFDLNLMQPGQSLWSLHARLMEALGRLLTDIKPNMVIIQGDTSSAFCGALAAFYLRVPVAHVEAGLRTFNLQSPFPEEMNRVLTTRLTALHFAPTEKSADNLRLEGVPADRLFVTGNTVIDALLWTTAALRNGSLPPQLPVPLDPEKKAVVVTVHRRESFGAPLDRICQALAKIARSRPDVQMVWPVHPNPAVKAAVARHVGAITNVILLEPLSYVPFVELMMRSYIILTDSGGVQEEAPTLGKPILVLRDNTERPEAVDAGAARLVGSDMERLQREVTTLLDDPEAYRRMSQVRNPYGDGQASVLICEKVLQFVSAARQEAPFASVTLVP